MAKHIKKAIQQETVFHVQWSDCPIEVEDEVQSLWKDHRLGNDTHFYNWNSNNERDYPIIKNYLESQNVTECLIIWWW